MPSDFFRRLDSDTWREPVKAKGHSPLELALLTHVRQLNQRASYLESRLKQDTQEARDASKEAAFCRKEASIIQGIIDANHV